MVFLHYKEKQAIETTQRLNDQIRISPVRVIDQDGEQLGVIPTAEALRLAMEANLDLVEVASDAKPPVCRIM
ncbi:MAG TPA: translation initiation factor IF-3, partial [Planctomycetaceae bacterium]|nr:translation initiation factor IF-3 [Planctomycetaceae bacterium]